MRCNRISAYTEAMRTIKRTLISDDYKRLPSQETHAARSTGCPIAYGKHLLTHGGGIASTRAFSSHIAQQPLGAPIAICHLTANSAGSAACDRATV